MKSLAIIAEDLSEPLDEGFKKASAAVAASIARLGIATHVFARISGGHGRQGSLGPSEGPGRPGGSREIGRLPSNKLLLGSAFSRRLRAIRPDAILYIPEAAATPAGLLRARLLKMQAGGPPTAVLSLQARRYPPPVAPFLRLLRPDLVLALSHRTRKALESAGIPAALIPLGVDTAAFRPCDAARKQALREKYGVTAEKVMLHVGHVSRRRNLGALLGAIGPGRQLVMVSSTATKREADVRRALEASKAILIDRFLEDIGEIYQVADCYLFPTWSEQGAIEMPLSVLEAMAANLPVVTTPFGGIPDFFAEGHGLFMASSAEEFAEKIELALALGRDDVSTRDLVESLAWDKVAGQIVGAVAGAASRSGRA